MQINASTDSIVDEIRDLTDTDSTSYTIAAIIRRVNAAYEELVGDIVNADGTWQFDDTNHTDLPRGLGTLVEGQETYSFASEYLQIQQIEVLDTHNQYIKLQPIDVLDLRDQSPQEYFGVDSSGNPQTGLPQYFDQVGDTIFLYPAPTAGQVTLTNGIRVWFKRTVDLFTTSDTSQSPALPSPYHVLLAYMAALPYDAKYHQQRVPWLERKIGSPDPVSPYYGGMRKSLVEFYAQREKSRIARLTTEVISHD